MNLDKNEDKFCESKIAYLQMIQGVIDRMATSSAIFKGFSAAIVAGVSAISLSDIKLLILIISFTPLLTFLALDIYYLRLEKRYRCLYEQVRSGEKSSDFVLIAPDIKTLKGLGKKDDVSIWECIKSPSIFLFYIPMIVICVLVIIIRCI